MFRAHVSPTAKPEVLDEVSCNIHGSYMFESFDMLAVSVVQNVSQYVGSAHLRPTGFFRILQYNAVGNGDIYLSSS